MRTIELLAPAKNLECGLAAINAGADAVYIGAPKFSARAAAHNSLDDIRQLVQRAHLFRARVYVALNTILYDHELEEAAALIWQLYEIGADAVIIQDMGLLECTLPPIAIHASTQANNRTAAKVRFLQSVGFGQVVLARELSLDQIREISSQTAVPLEYFVHGALCVSYSGQCYISQSKAMRSANRGDCAQFCRHAYTLTDSAGKVIARNKHLLSLRDLDLSHRLEDLVDAGIASFKIEGRLKDVAYVKNVTAHYRRELDAILARRTDIRRLSSGTVTVPFRTDPSKTFNRGQSEYFLDGRTADMVNQLSPKNMGELLGTVAQSQGRRIRLSQACSLANGDGLSYFDARGELVGVRLSRVDGQWLEFNTDVHIPFGTAVYRNADFEFNKQLMAQEPVRQMGVRFVVSEREGAFVLVATDEDGVAAETVLAFEKQLASNPEKAHAAIVSALTKTGGTPFRADAVAVELAEPCFFPASVLNDARRNVLALLEDARMAAYRTEPRVAEADPQPFPTAESTYYDNISNAKSKEFYERHGVRVGEMAFEYERPAGERPLMVTKYCIRYELAMCPRFQPKSGESFTEPFFLQDGAHRFRLLFDCKRCEMEVWG